MNNEFHKYATKHLGISSLGLEKYTSTVQNYISPTIIEERQLNIATMDVFSRLMMGFPVARTSRSSSRACCPRSVG